MSAKTTLAALFLMVFGAACNAPEPAPPAAAVPETPRVRSMAPADNVSWYQSCWGHFNRKAWSEFRDCYSVDAVSTQAGYGGAMVKGPAAIAKSSEDFATAAPDVRGVPLLILAHGPHVASIHVLSGTNSGPLIGPDGKQIPATGKTFSQLFGHHVAVGADGKVAEELGVQDTGTMLSHLGLSKEPAPPRVPAPAGAPTIVIAKGDDTEAKNVEVIRQGYAAFNKHDMKGVEALESPSFVLHELPAPADQNLAQNRAAIQAIWKGFPDSHFDITTAWGAGDYVVLTGAIKGTNTGNFAPMKANKTGRAVDVPALEIDRLVDGKMVESWLFYDGMAFVQQLMAPAK